MQRKSVLQLVLWVSYSYNVHVCTTPVTKKLGTVPIFWAFKVKSPCSVVKSAIRLCLSDFLSDQKVLHFQFSLEDLFVYNITPVVLLKSKLPPSRETRFL